MSCCFSRRRNGERGSPVIHVPARLNFAGQTDSKEAGVCGYMDMMTRNESRTKHLVVGVVGLAVRTIAHPRRILALAYNNNPSTTSSQQQNNRRQNTVIRASVVPLASHIAATPPSNNPVSMRRRASNTSNQYFRQTVRRQFDSNPTREQLRMGNIPSMASAKRNCSRCEQICIVLAELNFLQYLENESG
ncbi:hypothetical protein B0H19DRAFT_1061209 [Mycena capillaripes]|nr:hypothetical protein B0H19DRAFT_1061209 [Mycena capillaripes]